MCLGNEGSGFFAGLVKKALGQQLAFQLLEGLLQGTEACRLDVLNNNLEITAVLIECNLAADSYLISLLRQCPDTLVHSPEHGAANLAFPVFQGKIPVTG